MSNADDVLTHGKKDALVIVAIPEETDPVWKISSETVPHLTLLYFGEQDLGEEEQRVVEFVEHAAKTGLNKFYMTVDRRGPLGDDDADVLFFEKRGWDTKAINEFRANLLRDDTLNALYNSVEQYPEWTPHLTLGYPETPANQIEGYERQYSVCFDRIAVWTKNSDGPTFRLESPEYAAEVAMSDVSKTAVDKVLSHYGVRGMKWGVRRTDAQLARAAAASDDYKTAAAARSKPASSLSNQELQTLITRMNLEKQYSQLLASPEASKTQSRTRRGAAYAGKIIREIADTEIKRVSKAAVAIAVENKLQDQKVSGKDFSKAVGKRIVPKKK